MVRRARAGRGLPTDGRVRTSARLPKKRLAQQRLNDGLHLRQSRSEISQDATTLSDRAWVKMISGHRGTAARRQSDEVGDLP